MSVSESQNKLVKEARFFKMFKHTRKPNLLIIASRKSKESGRAVSQAGKRRWPQATMVVMGGKQRHQINTEMLSVTTKNFESLNSNSVLVKESLPVEELANARTNLPDIVPRFQKVNKTVTKRAARAASSELSHSSKVTKSASTMQRWSNQLNGFEEANKQKYFSWQVALRERLLKQEQMQHQEAITRIKKHRELSSNNEEKLSPTLRQRDGKATCLLLQTDVSMTPLQKWTEFILKETKQGSERETNSLFCEQVSLLSGVERKGNEGLSTSNGKDIPQVKFPSYTSMDVLPNINKTNVQYKPDERTKEAKLQLLLQSGEQWKTSKDKNFATSSTADQQVYFKNLEQSKHTSGIQWNHDGFQAKTYSSETNTCCNRKKKAKSDDKNQESNLSGVKNHGIFHTTVVQIEQTSAFNQTANYRKIEETTERHLTINKKSSESTFATAPVIDEQSGTTQQLKNLKQENENDDISPNNVCRTRSPTDEYSSPAMILRQKYLSNRFQIDRESVDKENHGKASEKQHRSPRITNKHPIHRAKEHHKKTETAGRHKAFGNKVAEPLPMEKKRIRRKEKTKSRKKLHIDPSLVNNFTMALLNSELELRAPSSSPVDMLFRYNRKHGNDPVHFLPTQTEDDFLLSSSNNGQKEMLLHINSTDGLPPLTQREMEGILTTKLSQRSILNTKDYPKEPEDEKYNIKKEQIEVDKNNHRYMYAQHSNQIPDSYLQQRLQRHYHQSKFNKSPWRYCLKQTGGYSIHNDEVLWQRAALPQCITVNNHGNFPLRTMPLTRFSIHKEEPCNMNASQPTHREAMLPNVDPKRGSLNTNSKPSASQLQKLQSIEKSSLTVKMPEMPHVCNSTNAVSKPQSCERKRQYVYK